MPIVICIVYGKNKMGLKIDEVKLEDYNSSWQQMFLDEKEQLESLFGNVALSIEHIGSTSVKGLKAKPIIDIAIGVNKLNDFLKVKYKFSNEPYSVKDNSTSDEILVCKKSGDATNYLIHVMEIDSKRYQNTIIFRDYLRSNPKVLKEYQELKDKLAIKYKNNRPMYTASKKDFINSVIEMSYKKL